MHKCLMISFNVIITSKHVNYRKKKMVDEFNNDGSFLESEYQNTFCFLFIIF